jgi:hypothetical protein
MRLFAETESYYQVYFSGKMAGSCGGGRSAEPRKLLQLQSVLVIGASYLGDFKRLLSSASMPLFTIFRGEQK